MTGAYTRRGVVVLVVLAVGLSVAAPALGAPATVSPDGETSGTTVGDGLDGSGDDSTNSTDDGSTSDTSDSGSSGGDSDGTLLGDDDGSTDGGSTDGGSTDGSTFSDESADGGSSDGSTFSDESADGGSSDDSTFSDESADDGSSDGSTFSDESADDGESVTRDWSIPDVNTVEETETAVPVLSGSMSFDEQSLEDAELVDIDRTTSETTSTTSTTTETVSGYEVQLADLSPEDSGALLEFEADGDAVTSTSVAADSLTASVGSVTDELSGDGDTDTTAPTTSSGTSSTTAASLDAAEVRDGADRSTGATGGGANDLSDGTTADTDDTAGSTDPAEAAASSNGLQALGLNVPTDEVPVPSGPAGVGLALGATALAAAAVRQSTALSGMASGVATSTRMAVANTPASNAMSRLVRMLAPFRYSRYDDSDPLEHEARDAMFEVVEESPGTYLSEIADRADIPLSTARHHIRVLEREDLVSGAKVRGKRRFYPAYTDGIELAAAMNDDSTAAVIDALARLGAASVSDLADELGRDPSTISHHVQRLEEDEVIVRERDGRAVMNKLSPAARTMLDPEETASESPTAGEAMASD